MISPTWRRSRGHDPEELETDSDRDWLWRDCDGAWRVALATVGE